MLWSDYLSAVSHTSTILITGGNIYNFGHNPGSLDIALKRRLTLSKNKCTDMWLYILCLIENYTNGVIFNYIPEDYVRNQPFIHSSIVLWLVQDTEVVCHKKSPFHCLVQFVFICLHEFNEIT